MMPFFSMFSKRQEATPVDRRRSLKSIPVVNTNVSKEAREDGNLTVAVHLKRRPGIVGRFQPPTFTRTYKLDELGSFVYRQIDGERRVQQIIQAFVREFKVNQREGELCVAQFLKLLVQRQVISMVVP